MEITFDTRGNEKQKLCASYWCDNITTDTVYGGSKGSAKSYTGCQLIFGDALLYPETHYFIARKHLNDLRKFTIPSIHEVFKHWNLDQKYYKYNGNDNYFSLYNKSKVYLIDAKPLPSDPLYYRFGSMQMTRGWIEEAGEFELAAKNNLKASIGRWKNKEYNILGKLLQTCNPSKNYLYRDYYKVNKLGKLPEWIKFIQALPTDNKMLSDEYLLNLERTLTGNEKERLLKGNWEYDDNPFAMCDYEAILSMFENDHVQLTGKKYITADIARFGSDRAIVMVWDDWTAIECHIFDKSKTTDIQECINAMRAKHQIPKSQCVADEDGVGGGVVDNCGIKGFVNGSKPAKEIVETSKKTVPNFQNLQTQCIYYFAKNINDHKINLSLDLSEKNKEEIIEEMETIETYKTEVDGKLRIIPKEKVKEKIGRSPDWRDVLMMRKYFDLNVAPGGPRARVMRRD